MLAAGRSVNLPPAAARTGLGPHYAVASGPSPVEKRTASYSLFNLPPLRALGCAARYAAAGLAFLMSGAN
jgi:hypothetical protein